MKIPGVLLFSLLPTIAMAQTAEDAHAQHMRQLADVALNNQYRNTMAAMARADARGNAGLKDGSTKPDSRPTYQAALLAAERTWLAHRDAQCTSVGLVFRGGVYEDEAEGKCLNDMDRKRTAELKSLLDAMNEWH